MPCDNRSSRSTGRHLSETKRTTRGLCGSAPTKKIVCLRNWEDEKTRLAGVAQLLRALVKIARAEKPDVDMALPPPTPEIANARAARRV